MKLQLILILLLASVSLTGQGIMLAGGAVAEEQTGIVQNGLIIYLDANDTNSYPGSGSTWTNLVDGGVNFTIGSNVTFNSTNKFFTLGGTDKNITANSSISYGSDFTWAGWFYITDNTLNSMLIDVYNHDNSEDGYLLQAQSSRAGLEVHGRPLSSDSYTLFVQTSIDASYNTPLGQWFYITFVKEDAASTANYKLYVDGTLIVDKNNTIGFGDTFTDIYAIGGSQSPFIGRTDAAEVHIYDRALSETEIVQNYNATNRY